MTSPKAVATPDLTYMIVVSGGFFRSLRPAGRRTGGGGFVANTASHPIIRP
ncbi:MAG: hypothetical protein J0M04_03880 [Verrucomicrobia bacterium]|nr:hypothetical protein [Verrucomicrobiota bacterium]